MADASCDDLWNLDASHQTNVLEAQSRLSRLFTKGRRLTQIISPITRLGGKLVLYWAGANVVRYSTMVQFTGRAPVCRCSSFQPPSKYHGWYGKVRLSSQPKGTGKGTSRQVSSRPSMSFKFFISHQRLCGSGGWVGLIH